MITKEQACERDSESGDFKYHEFKRVDNKNIRAVRTGDTYTSKDLVTGEEIYFSFYIRIGCCKRGIIDNNNAHEWEVVL